jgi:ATP-dependent Clp protease protease subunit
MAKYYTINKKSSTEASISIFGDIGDSFWSEGVSAKDFKKELDALGDIKVLNIDINSPGGSFFEGLAIYNILQRHTATKNVTVLGLAASAASTIAMVGDKISISEDAYIMIHNAQTFAGGDKREMRKIADELDKFDNTIANIYAKKTKKDEKELHDMMDAETWLDGRTALAEGFVDEVTEAKKVAARYILDATNRFSVEAFKNTPKELLKASYTNGASDLINLYQEEVNLIKRRVFK